MSEAALESHFCAAHLPITMFVELDHSVVFLLYSATYLFPLVHKVCIYWSFEDEPELHMLCKDFQIAKRKKKKKELCLSELCVCTERKTSSLTQIWRVCACCSCAYVTGEENDTTILNMTIINSRSLCVPHETKVETHYMT